uniref:Tubby-like protein n=1 Tax=Globodera rostochiensis TaxID=31243 RepID=A0A914GTD8_GLORO
MYFPYKKQRTVSPTRVRSVGRAETARRLFGERRTKQQQQQHQSTRTSSRKCRKVISKMRLNDSGDRWVSHNLQRQKELLEKQRQRKLQANLSCTISTTNNQWNFSVDGAAAQRPPAPSVVAGGGANATFGEGILTSASSQQSLPQNDRADQSRGSSSLYSFLTSSSPSLAAPLQKAVSSTLSNNPFGSKIGTSAALSGMSEPQIITVKGITPPQSRKQSVSCGDGPTQKLSHENMPLKKPILNVERLEPGSSAFCSEGEDDEKGLSIQNDDNVAQLSPSSTTVLASKRPSWNVDGEDDDGGSIPTEILNEEPTETIDINDNLEQFVMEPTRKNFTLKCRITRDKHGVDKGIYPNYYLHLEKNDGRRTFLLAARKRKKSFIAKVRSNAMGTMFTIFDNGESPKKSSAIGDSVRRELAAVIYGTNILGLKGPRRMTIIIPGIYVDQKNNYIRPLAVRPISEKDSILERYKTNRLDEMVVLINKQPVWNEDSQSYILNFHGRVTEASVKNFQIVHSMHAQSYDGRQQNARSIEPNEYVIMQFGRIDDESFTMDVRYPLSPVQAFGIAMTSFHSKLACE